MSYEVKYDPKAEEDLDHLPKEISQRIIKKIRQVSETGNGIESIKNKAYGFKIRIGDYRALIDLTYNPHTIWVRFIGHRKKVYEEK